MPFPFFLPFLSAFFFSICRSPFFIFLFVLSFFSVCFLYRLRFSFRFLALLSGRLCYFVSVLTPPRAAREPVSLRIPLACCLLYCVIAFIYFIVILFPFFDFDLDVVCFLSFSCGYYYAVSDLFQLLSWVAFLPTTPLSGGASGRFSVVLWLSCGGHTEVGWCFGSTRNCKVTGAETQSIPLQVCLFR